MSVVVQFAQDGVGSAVSQPGQGDHQNGQRGDGEGGDDEDGGEGFFEGHGLLRVAQAAAGAGGLLALDFVDFGAENATKIGVVCAGLS